jgi:hypothetical protein
LYYFKSQKRGLKRKLPSLKAAVNNIQYEEGRKIITMEKVGKIYCRGTIDL